MIAVNDAISCVRTGRLFPPAVDKLSALARKAHAHATRQLWLLARLSISHSSLSKRGAHCYQPRRVA